MFLWIVVAYVVGHVIAQISSTVLEKGLVKKVLGYPSQVLFESPPSPESSPWKQLWEPPAEWRKVGRVLFPGYFEPLPPQICHLVKKNAEVGAKITSQPALFMYCDARVKRDEESAALLTTFLGLYGFARNVSIASLIAAILLVIGALADDANAESKALLAGAATGIGVFLLYRYLKFFRVYATEVFSAYAGLFPVAKSS